LFGNIHASLDLILTGKLAGTVEIFPTLDLFEGEYREILKPVFTVGKQGTFCSSLKLANYPWQLAIGGTLNKNTNVIPQNLKDASMPYLLEFRSSSAFLKFSLQRFHLCKLMYME